MILLANWREVLTRAWSVRWIALAFLFSILEIAVPYLDGLLPIPQGVFAALAGISSAGAFLFRLLAQRNLTGDS